MLDLAKIDLSSLAEALEDHSDETSWWLDPETGEVEPWSVYLDTEVETEHPEERGFLPVGSVDSHQGYKDMEDFIARVRDTRTKDLLERAIQGRGAFRRFKDTLFEFPELREAWFTFHDARMERRVLRWLADNGLIDEATAEKEIDGRPDPDTPELSGSFDAHAIAEAVARDLRELYGQRLRRVILFGSWARGDARPDSDIDLLIVVDDADLSYTETKRIGEVTYPHSLANDTLVSTIAVDTEDFERADWPVLVNARAEGIVIA